MALPKCQSSPFNFIFTRYYSASKFKLSPASKINFINSFLTNSFLFLIQIESKRGNLFANTAVQLIALAVVNYLFKFRLCIIYFSFLSYYIFNGFKPSWDLESVRLNPHIACFVCSKRGNLFVILYMLYGSH